MKRLLHGTALTLGLLALVSTARAESKDIVDTAVDAGSFKTLVAAVQAAGLVETLKSDGPFTVFAPTDEAFSKLPKGTLETLLKPENKGMLTSILTYHVVSGKVPASKVVKMSGAATVNGQYVDIAVGESVTLDGAKVVKTDIECSNGIIHVIDSVILPEDKSIVGVAQESGMFNTLLAAAGAAGLAEALDTKGPFTVFAPTDEAFSKLPEGTVESLLKPENKGKLAAILKYHVVSGKVYSAQALKVKKAETLEGSKVMIGVENGHAKVNSANLIKTDIDASNGVIHVIDAVLIPGSDEKPAKAVSQSTSHATQAAPCALQQQIVHSQAQPQQVYHSKRQLRKANR